MPSRRTHKVHPFTVTAGDVLVTGENGNRTAVLLQGSNGSFVTYRFGEVVTTFGEGINVANFDHPLMLTREQLGDLITRPIHALGGTPGHITSVVEFLDG